MCQHVALSKYLKHSCSSAGCLGCYFFCKKLRDFFVLAVCVSVLSCIGRLIAAVLLIVHFYVVIDLFINKIFSGNIPLLSPSNVQSVIITIDTASVAS